MTTERLCAAMAAAQAELKDWPVPCGLWRVRELSREDREVFELITEDGSHSGAVSVYFEGGEVELVMIREGAKGGCDDDSPPLPSPARE